MSGLNNPLCTPESAGSVARDNTLLENGDEQHGSTAHETQRGTVEGSSNVEDHALDESLLNIEEVIQRYLDQVRMRLRESTRKQYTWRIRRFIKNGDLANLTRQRFKSRCAALLKAQLERVPEHSRRFELSALRGFFELGLKVDWPSEVDAYLGQLPPIRRRDVPRSFNVEKWALAIENERDLYTKTVVLLIMSFGWRPDHLYKMKLRNVRCDESGQPCAIVADGAVEKFKTRAWVAAYLPPIVRTTLQEFKAERGPSKETDPLIPYRHPRGMENTRPINEFLLRRTWHRFEVAHKLPKLTPCDFRHHVCLKCDQAKMTNSASAYLVGHDSSRGETYRNWYANLHIDDALLEQEEKIPNGILGLLRKPEIELVRDMPRPLIDLVTQFLDGKIGEVDFAIQAGKVRNLTMESAKNLEP